MRHLDLFAGIGGFSLAADWVWGKEHEIVTFVEIDPFCQAVLRKHWPDVPMHSDIKDFDGRTIANTTGERLCDQANQQELEGKRRGELYFGESRPFFGIDLLTGGFPCQPYSCAGKRRGKDDDRALWPEMYRVIRETRPRWIIGENVAGFINLGLDESIADLEMEGYTVQAFIIPACAVNAPHRRDRVWIVGYSSQLGLSGINGRWAGQESENGHTQSQYCPHCQESYPESSWKWSDGKCPDCGWPVANNGLREPVELSGSVEKCGAGTGNGDQNAPDTQIPRLEGIDATGSGCAERRIAEYLNGRNKRWEEGWLEVATRLCGIPHGFSEWLDENWRRINGTATKTITRQEVSDLWDYFQSETVQRDFRGQYPLLKKDNLFAVLWKLKAESDLQTSIAFEGVKIQEGLLRAMREEGQTGCSPQRREHVEQQSGEPSDALSQLSYEVALGAESAFRWWRFSSDNLHRVDRLKSLGNAIVPQVAAVIMQAIKDIDARAE